MVEEKQLTIGEKIKELRTLKGLSQADLSKKIGIGKTTISNYETGYSKPLLDIIIKISRALDASLEYFYTPEEIEYFKDNHMYFTRVTKIPVFEIKTDYETINSNNTAHVTTYVEIPSINNLRVGNYVIIRCPDNAIDKLNIKKGDFVVINRFNKENSFDIDLMDNGKIYAFEYQNKTYIRRLFFGNSNTFTIVTDSISMPQKPITVSFNEIKIIGQCINAIIEI